MTRSPVPNGGIDSWRGRSMSFRAPCRRDDRHRELRAEGERARGRRRQRQLLRRRAPQLIMGGGGDIGLAEGRDIGLAEGRDIGLAEGRDIGLAEGRDMGLECECVDAKKNPECKCVSLCLIRLPPGGKDIDG
eukprot:gene2790-biopygen7811